MGTQQQSSDKAARETNQGRSNGAQGSQHERSAAVQTDKAADAGNVPRSDDDLIEQEAREGTREDGAGPKS